MAIDDVLGTATHMKKASGQVNPARDGSLA
jgi:hypothetical protein